MKTLFKVPEVHGDTKFKDYPICKWIRANNIGREHNDMDVVDMFLDSLGFDKDKNIADSDQLKHMLTGVKISMRAWMPTFKKQKLDTLLKDGGGFSLWQSDTRKKITPKLMGYIEEFTLVYPLEPKHFYFTIINRDDGRNFLHIKYQHIIGGRTLCELEGEA